MEKDDEVNGGGNSYTSDYRQYDTRLGRWKSIDPKFQKLPNQSPYANNNNNPISFTDPKGDFGWLGAAIGAVVGAAVEIGSQAVSNVVQGKPAFSKIDWADVAIASGEGAFIGSGVGLVAAAAAKVVSAVGKTTIDVAREDGKTKVNTVGGFIGDKKDARDIAADGLSNAIGFSIGGIGLGEVMSKSVIRGASGGIATGQGKIFGKVLVGELTGGAVEGSLLGGVTGGVISKVFGGNNTPAKQNPGATQIGGYAHPDDVDSNGNLKPDAKNPIRIDKPLDEITITPK